MVAKVRAWSDEEGWGVLTADDVPGDIFVHFSNIQMDGYKTLKPGQRVEIEIVEQPVLVEGCPYAAEAVRPLP